MRLERQEDIDVATAAIAAEDPGFARLLDVTGRVLIRRRRPGFQALLQIILGQQVSVASAEAVWARLGAHDLQDRARVAAANPDTLRACGLSRQKSRYALELARSDLDFDDLDRLDDPDVISALTALPGIGVWSAEIYAMFALGRADVFAAGDLALKEAARAAFDLPERPDERSLRGLAARWSPWRTVAATALWQYYAIIKQREGAMT